MSDYEWVDVPDRVFVPVLPVQLLRAGSHGRLASTRSDFLLILMIMTLSRSGLVLGIGLLWYTGTRIKGSACAIRLIFRRMLRN